MNSRKKLSRRDFLKLSSSTLLVGATAMPDVALASDPDKDEATVRNWGFAILQGLTTNDSTQLTIDVPKDMYVDYRLVDSQTGEVMPAYYRCSESRTYSDWRVDKLGYENLSCPRRYIFQVTDQKGKVIEERFLKTLDLNRRDTRFALISCQLDWSIFKGGMWKSLAKSKPDVLFFIGDNVYGDLGLKQGPSLLWERYYWARRQIAYYKWKELVPVIASWDDHDFGCNDAGGNYKYKSNSADTFRAFFAQKPREGFFFEGPGGVASIFKAFGQQFIFADNRSQRRLPGLDGPGLMGDEQLKWVLQTLKSEDGPVWFMQGSQSFQSASSVHSEPYETTFAGEWSVLLKGLRALNIPVIFGSGDIHFSEVMKIGPEYLGFDTFELTSSAMHSFPCFSRPDNVRRTHAIWHENYFVIDLKPSNSELVFDLAGQGFGQKLYFKEKLSVG